MRLSLFTLLSLLTPVKSEANDTVALGVDVYECDKDANYLDNDNKQIKQIGKAYRLCMRPNKAGIDAGIQIKALDNWEWMTGDDDSINQKVVTNGKGIPMISSFKCYEEKSLCIFDSTLTADFYHDPGTVSGVGEAVLTDGEVETKVPLKFNLFLANFEIILSDELKGIMDSMKEQAEAADDEGPSKIALSADTMSEEL